MNKLYDSNVEYRYDITTEHVTKQGVTRLTAGE